MPGEAKADPVKSKDAYLIERPQYVLSYNDRRKAPTGSRGSWYPRTSAGSRAAPSRKTSDLPKEFQRVQFTTYTGSGFDRGHLCPSKDRSAAEKDNDAVFLMTNIIPQSPACNQKGWERLESYCRDLAFKGKELYIAAGPHGIGGTDDNGKKKLTIGRAAPFVTVPTSVWKVVLVLDKGTNPHSKSPRHCRLDAQRQHSHRRVAGLSRFGRGNREEDRARSSSRWLRKTSPRT